jgi:uncharacterized protein (TIGR00730 family)
MATKPRKLPKPAKPVTLTARHLPLRAIALEAEKQLPLLTEANIAARLKVINREFRRAYELLKNEHNTVTFFGSSVLPDTSPYCVQARALAAHLARKLDVTIVSGGGSGIMAAANRGAHDAKEESLGFTIELPHEEAGNPYATHSVDFYYFFSRKVALTFTARAFIYFPGGFGTLDELFEILTLKQTGKIPPVPIILCGADFWPPLLDFIQTTLFEKLGTISRADLNLYHLTDNPDEIVHIISASKLSNNSIKAK